ncbi:hypothetical protein Tco_0841563 [Tanacetum coccineum]|uniref:Reverse transcriptase domain-containing protein n=1 Tax=Tanacetum coccineum TaxID=301880 RepID=A0ABQ5AWQ2_9ASTR
MEGLHYAFSNAVTSGLIRVIKIESSDIMLCHLFYADDVVITTEWNAGDLDNIIRVLHVFYLALGLKINIHKSNIYGIRVLNEEMSIIASQIVLQATISANVEDLFLQTPYVPPMTLKIMTFDVYALPYIVCLVLYSGFVHPCFVISILSLYLLTLVLDDRYLASSP